MNDYNNYMAATSEAAPQQDLTTNPSKNLAQQVLNKVENFVANNELMLPENYAVGNALNQAMLKIQQDDKLKNCTQASTAEVLLKMCILGLNPAKEQCYFIPMGRKMTLFPSYLGNYMALKRLPFIDSDKLPVIEVIRQGQEIELGEDEELRTIIKSHKKPFETLNNEIIGAYAVIYFTNGTKHTEIMTIDQIINAWNQGNAKGNSMAHKNFKDQMAKRTVLNRAVKMILKTTDDTDLFSSTFAEVYSEENTIPNEMKNNAQDIAPENLIIDPDYV